MSASSCSRLWSAGGTCDQLWWAISWPAFTTASHSRGQVSIVKPGVNHVERMLRDCRSARMRGAARAPNSPRDRDVGVVRPRAMKPDMVSKSKVRQTMWRGTADPLDGVSIGAHVIRELRRRIHLPCIYWMDHRVG